MEVKRLLLHPKLLPGFNDSGAHVTNMAYFDGNLRALHIALEDGEQTFSHMVGRLTREPAAFFGLDRGPHAVGSLQVGGRADITLLNPDVLKSYDGEASVQYIYRDVFDCHQLVNRSDGVVESVFVAGEPVWQGNGFAPAHGNKHLGESLRVGTV